MKTGAELIAEERQRQVEIEDWSSEHDNDHTEGQLAMAAICYAFDAVTVPTIEGFVNDHWPWDWKWWNPTPDNTVRQLTKAGALIAAEIDRIQRGLP